VAATAPRPVPRTGAMDLTYSPEELAFQREVRAWLKCHVPLPALGSVALPLRMQLQGNGLCWEAVYSAPQENSTARFEALAD
jgi:hypothetical protein